MSTWKNDPLQIQSGSECGTQLLLEGWEMESDEMRGEKWGVWPQRSGINIVCNARPSKCWSNIAHSFLPYRFSFSQSLLSSSLRLSRTHGKAISPEWKPYPAVMSLWGKKNKKTAHFSPLHRNQLGAQTASHAARWEQAALWRRRATNWLAKPQKKLMAIWANANSSVLLPS